MLSAYLKDDFNVDIEKTEKKIIEAVSDPTDEEVKKDDSIKGFESSLISKGYLPYASGECYEKQITHNSYVFIQKLKKFRGWTGYRITYDEDNNIQSERTIIENISFMLVLNRVEMYIKNYLDFIKKLDN